MRAENALAAIVARSATDGARPAPRRRPTTDYNEAVSLRPRAREEGLLIEELEDELLVYDQQHDTASRLNRTAAIVWRACDGERTVAELADALGRELTAPPDQDLVMITLDYLDEQELLEPGYPQRDLEQIRLSRRRFIRRAGTVAGAGALALPVVQSIVAPTPAAAQSLPGPTGPQGSTGPQGPTGPA
jgi:hypothetical protein